MPVLGLVPSPVRKSWKLDARSKEFQSSDLANETNNPANFRALVWSVQTIEIPRYESDGFGASDDRSGLRVAQRVPQPR